LQIHAPCREERGGSRKGLQPSSTGIVVGLMSFHTSRNMIKTASRIAGISENPAFMVVQLWVMRYKNKKVVILGMYTY
jgi:hypothetical protein